MPVPSPHVSREQLLLPVVIEALQALVVTVEWEQARPTNPAATVALQGTLTEARRILRLVAGFPPRRDHDWCTHSKLTCACGAGTWCLCRRQHQEQHVLTCAACQPARPDEKE